MKQFIVVAYDIRNNRRRRKVAELLELYGDRANKSVFECFLNKSAIAELKAGLKKLIRKKDDLVLCYFLCRQCLERKERLGGARESHAKVESV